MKKIGFIGTGNIAKAILNGILTSGAYRRGDICAYDIDEAKKAAFTDGGLTVCADEADVVNNAKYIFVCVRPCDINTVLENIKGQVTSANVIITVAAGISIAYYKRALGRECKVVRLMPNTPLTVGKGAVAMAYEMPITYAELTEVKSMLEASGVVEILDEARMNEVISVSSSSPAYFYMLMRAMINSAVAQGIDEQTARRLVESVAEGSIELVKRSDKSLDDMIAEVCTPNGTTAKAVEMLEKHGFEQAVGDAMLACTKRAYGLEREITD